MASVTEQLLLAGKSPAGGWNRAQLELVGVPWPPPKGWKKAALGKTISEDAAAQFLLLRGNVIPANPGESASKK